MDPTGLGLIGFIWNAIKCSRWLKNISGAIDECHAELPQKPEKCDYDDQNEWRKAAREYDMKLAKFIEKYGGGFLDTALYNCVKKKCKDNNTWRKLTKYCSKAAILGAIIPKG